VKKAIHVPTHRFVALKCISVLEKARTRTRARQTSDTATRPSRACPLLSRAVRTRLRWRARRARARASTR
jgi:hypothetical protein